MKSNYPNLFNNQSKPRTKTTLQKPSSPGEKVSISIQLEDNKTITIMSSSPSTTNNASASTGIASFDASTLTDEELAKKAQDELNMESEMEEVRK